MLRSRWKWLACLLVVVLAVAAFALTVSIDPQGYSGGGTQPHGPVAAGKAPPGPGDPNFWQMDLQGLHLRLNNGAHVLLTRTVDDEGNICYVRAGFWSNGVYSPSVTAYFWSDGTFSLWIGGTANVTPNGTYDQD